MIFNFWKLGLDRSWMISRSGSHLVSKFWKKSPCKVVVNRSVWARTASCAPVTRKYSWITYAICVCPGEIGLPFGPSLILQTDFPSWSWDSWWSSSRRTRSSHQASQSSGICAPIDRDVSSPLVRPSQLLWSTTQLPWESLNWPIPRSWTSFSNIEMLKDRGTYRNAYLRLDSLVVQPCSAWEGGFQCENVLANLGVRTMQFCG